MDKVEEEIEKMINSLPKHTSTPQLEDTKPKQKISHIHASGHGLANHHQYHHNIDLSNIEPIEFKSPEEEEWYKPIPENDLSHLLDSENGYHTKEGDDDDLLNQGWF